MSLAIRTPNLRASILQPSPATRITARQFAVNVSVKGTEGKPATVTINGFANNIVTEHSGSDGRDLLTPVIFGKLEVVTDGEHVVQCALPPNTTPTEGFEITRADIELKA